MFFLGMLMMTVFCIMYFMPSPLITTIMTETGWDTGMSGSLISIIALLTGIFVFASSPIMDKLGVKKCGVISMSICCLGGIVPFFAQNSYILHMIGRILFGVGYGLGFNICAVIITLWFPSNLQPTMQGLRTGLSYVAMSLPYYIIIPIYSRIKSWQVTFGILGLCAGVVGILFLLFARNVSNVVDATIEKEKDNTVTNSTNNEKSGLAQAVCSLNVWKLALSMFCINWTFSAFNTYLPTFLQIERGYELELASSFTGIMNIAGAVAGFSCGFLATLLGRRKLFGWPMFLFGIVGMLLTVYFGGTISVIGMILFGFGASGFNIILSTVPAELPESNPKFYAGAMALITGCAFIPGFFMPTVFSALYKGGAGLSIGTIFIIFGVLLVIGLLATAIIPETGPKGKRSMNKLI